MSETPSADTTADAPIAEPAAAKRPTRKAAPSPAWWQSPRWPAFAALLLALIATGIATAAWFRPSHSTPTFSAQQVADAKTHVCSAYTVVRQGVVTNTHLANPVPNDPAGQLAVAANARLALLGGGAFLQDRLAAEPAAPADLSTGVGTMATTLEELGAGYLAGLNSTLNPLRQQLDTRIVQLNQLCQ